MRENTLAAKVAALQVGDVLAVIDGGGSVIMRHVANGPPLGIRPRLAQEGTLQRLVPRTLDAES